VTKFTKRIFARTNVKYYSSEILASLLAVVLSAACAVLMDKLTDSDAAISIVSALGGTMGFLAGTSGIYAMLHIRQYRRGERNFIGDMRSILSANIRGILAMYVFRIPCQYILQKFGVTPAVAAVISQCLSGLIATVFRIHHNYKKGVFGFCHENTKEKAKGRKRASVHQGNR